MKSWLLVISALLLPISILSADEPAKPLFERKQDIIYGRKQGTALTMDVVTPTGARNGAGVIAVISGGWRSSHDEIRNGIQLSDEVLKRGYTIFAVVHGSQPKYSIPECIDDLTRAVRFIRHNAKDYGVDPDRIGITGASSGCHLSLMIGVNGADGQPKAKDPVERESCRVQAVAGFFPPTDFFNYGREGTTAEVLTRAGPFAAAFDFKERELLTNNWKPVSDTRRKEILKEICPIYHVTPQTPPTLLIHGDQDYLVPLQQSRIMIDKLKSENVPCELIVHPGGGHGWRGIEKDVSKIADWFDKYLVKKDK
jgi:acetyl esterase/lipase